MADFAEGASNLVRVALRLTDMAIGGHQASVLFNAADVTSTTVDLGQASRVTTSCRPKPWQRRVSLT